MTGSYPPIATVVVIIPTYNERENLEPVAARVRAAAPAADLLIVDDNSPDGTGELADKLAAADAQVHVLHRPGKPGSARPTWPGSAGPTTVTTSWSRWTPTAPTSPNSCPACWLGWTGPT